MTDIKSLIDEKSEVFERYFEYLAEYGSVHNLTSVLDREGVFERHFADSLAGAGLLPAGAKVLDVGSGAGFPGVPLKIVREDIRLTVLDSVRKKTVFLENLRGILGVDYTVVTARCEDYAERGFDAVTARAVAPLNVLLEYTLPFVRVGGVVLAYKNADLDGEIAGAKHALSVLKGRVGALHKYENAGAMRAVAVIVKTAESPATYPRPNNKARLNPL